MIKPVDGFDGYYIDDQGHVYSQWINKGIHGLVKGDKLKRLKTSKSKSGHMKVQFGRKAKQQLVHRLVFKTFNGEIPPGMVVRHLNDNPSDNRIENLNIGSQKDNVSDAKRNNIFPVGSKNGQSKLTEKDVLEIRALAETETCIEISRKYNVSRRAINHVVNKTTWKHVN